jgi:hypothetical protein
MGARTLTAQQQLLNRCYQSCPKVDCLPGDIPIGAPMAQCIKACRTRCDANLQQAAILPKYIVLMVLYSPPGCSNTATYHCAATGSVDYSVESSAGTKTSISDSFKVGSEVTVDAGFSFGGVTPISVTGTGGISTTETDTRSVSVSKTSALGIKVQGNGDGINHDQDDIVILVNPAVSVASLNRLVSWNLGFVGPSAVLMHLSLGWLTKPDTMPVNVATALGQHGITKDDYPDIANQDPFVVADFRISPPRFVPTTWVLPYEPPATSNSCNGGVCTSPVFTETLKNQLQAEISHQTQTQYTTTFAVKAGDSGASFKNTNTLQWTNTSTATNTSSDSNSASATIASPSPDYAGPVLIAVYWDTIYGSFVFVPVQGDDQLPLQTGRVTDAAGNPKAFEAIELTVAGGLTFHTLTNADGAFKLFGAPAFTAGPEPHGHLFVSSTQRKVTVGSADQQLIKLQ